jgi:hypothetical protein
VSVDCWRSCSVGWSVFNYYFSSYTYNLLTTIGAATILSLTSLDWLPAAPVLAFVEN